MDIKNKDNRAYTIKLWIQNIFDAILIGLLLTSVVFVSIWGYRAFRSGHIFEDVPIFWISVLFGTIVIPSVLTFAGDRNIGNLVFNITITPLVYLSCAYFFGGIISVSIYYGIIAAVGIILSIIFGITSISYGGLD